VKKAAVPYRRTVFVCTNVRADGRVACANPGRGGAEICESLKNAVKKLGLKGRVRVARSGCLDLCEKGPNLFIYPDGEWRSGLTEQDVPEVIELLKS
jgi:(2Fe-2S) ferredoxin